MTEDTRDSHQSPKARPGGRTRNLLRLLVLVVVAATFIGLLIGFREQLSLEFLASQEQKLRSYYAAHPVLLLAAAFLLYVLMTGLSLPGASPLSVVYGWLFGFPAALLVVSFASTGGATLAFLLSRFLLGQWLQERFGDRLREFNRALERDGPFYLFTLRLIPAVPFFVINLLMGLTPIRARTFWWVSQLGMLPGTCLYVFAGSSLPTLNELSKDTLGSLISPPLLIAFVALGLFPLLVRKLADRWRAR